MDDRWNALALSLELFGLRRSAAVKDGSSRRCYPWAPMELHGTIEANLISAIRSARRFRAQPVHGETIEHWRRILARAESDLSRASSSEREALRKLISDLKSELTFRESYYGPSS